MKMKKLFKKLTKNTSLSILALIIIGIPLLYLTVLNSKPASAWWDDNWTFRKSIAVTNNIGGQNNVYISVTLDTSDTTRFKSTCGDLRFTKQGGELLPYYIVSGCGSAATVIHVNFNSFPSGAQTIYYYYGNLSALDGFNSADFSTLASNYTVGTIGSEEKSEGPIVYWKFDEGQGSVAKNYGSLATTAADSITSSGSYTFSAGTTTLGVGTTYENYDITIPSGATVNMWGAHTFASVTVESGGVLDVGQYGESSDSTRGSLNITANTVTVSGTGQINAYGRGFGGGAGAGPGGTTGNSTVDGAAGGTGAGGVGGGYGGGGGGGTALWAGTSGSYGAGNGGNGGSGYCSEAGGGGGGGSVNACSASNGTTPPGTTGGAGGAGCSGGGTGGRGGDGNPFGTLGGGGAGGGSGPFGGIGGAGGQDSYSSNGQNGFPGGYKATGANGDSSTDFPNISMGSGGGGGGAGSPHCTVPCLYGQAGDGGSGGMGGGTHANCGWPGGGGGGSAGGGAVSINASASITISGQIIADGAGKAELTAGYGAGGGIALRAPAIDLTSATIRSLGGNNTGAGVTTNGGTVKVFTNSYTGSTLNTTNFPSGRVYNGVYSTAATNNNDGAISNATWTTEDACISGKCLSFNGTSATVGIGSTVSAVKTVSFWVRPKTNGESIINFDGGTHTITATSGTISANGFTSPTIYVDGAVSRTLTANKWQMVTITTNTSFISSALTLGKVSSTYLSGFIDEFKIYNYVKTPAQIKADFTAKSGASSNHGSSTVLGSSSVAFLSEGLVGYWKMDEASGNLTDSSGNGITGTDTSTTVVSGMFGNGRSFGGGTNNINMGNSSLLDFSASASFSIAVWVKTSGPSSGAYTFFSKKNNGGADNAGYMLFEDTTGLYFRLIDGSSGGSDASTTNKITDNAWHHLVGIVDRKAQIVSLYQDGTLIKSTSISAVGSLSNSYNFYLGQTASLGLNPYTGSLDEARVYNRALSPKEVSDLYNFAPGPVGYWNFDEGSGGSANDTSGNGYTGTWAGTGSHWTNGKYGKAGNFNGSSDYINTNQDANFDFGTNNFTVSFWAKRNSIGLSEIIGKWDGTGGWYVSFMANNTFLIDINPAGVTVLNFNSTAAITDTNWHYYSCVRTSTTNVDCYQDGVAMAGTRSVNGTPAADSASNLMIGGIDTGASGFFSGSIDDVKIYNYARTQKQIVSDMNAGHPAVGSPIGSAVGYWTFDEGSGVAAHNSGNGSSALDGNLTNIATAPSTATSGWTNSGKFGKALLFDGTDDAITLPNSASLRPTSAISVSAWVNKTTTAGFTQVFTTLSSPFGYQLGYSGDTPYFALEIGASWIGTPATATSPSTGTWHHIIGIYDGSSITTYVDGKKYESVTASGSISYSSDNFKIGGHTSSQFFKGTMDEVKIYPYALTADEVKTEFNRGQSVQMGATGTNSSYQPQAENQAYCVPGDSTSCAAPVGEWNFEEGTGGSANDTSGNGYVGTWHGTGSHWTAGKIGKAGTFNGVDDYVSGTSAIVTSLPMTIEAWVKLNKPIDWYFEIAGEDGNEGLYLSTNPWNHDFTVVATSCSELESTTRNPVAGRWYHLAGTWDGSVEKIFVNGVLENFANCSGSLSPNPWFIAHNNWYSPITVDDVKFYNYVRTPAQIAWEYNKGGPVGSWNFDECQGNVAYDSADLAAGGSGNNGTINFGTLGQTALGTCTANANTMWYNGRTGKRGASLNFDGSDDYVDVGNVTLLKQSQLSVSTWVKLTAYTADAYFVSFGDTSANGYHLGTYNGGGPNTFTWFMGGGPGIPMYSRTVPSLGVWYHVVGTDDGTTRKIYVNGVLENSGATNHAFVTPTTNFIIGRRGQGTNFINGQIDDVRVYNYVLTATQVKDVYNGGAINYGPVTGSP